MKLTIAAASTVLSASTTTLTTAEKVGLAASIDRIGQLVRGGGSDAAAVDERSTEHGGAPRFEEGVPEAAAEAGAASAGHEHKAIRFGRLVSTGQECTPMPRSSGDQAEEGVDLGILGCPDSEQICVQDTESSLGGICRSVVSRDLMQVIPPCHTMYQLEMCDLRVEHAYICLIACWKGLDDYEPNDGYTPPDNTRECVDARAYPIAECALNRGWWEGYDEGKDAVRRACTSQVDTARSEGFEAGIAAAGPAKQRQLLQSQIYTMCKSKACAETKYCGSSHSTNPEVFDATKKIRG